MPFPMYIVHRCIGKKNLIMNGIFFKQTFTTSIKILVDLLKGVTNNDGFSFF